MRTLLGSSCWYKKPLQANLSDVGPLDCDVTPKRKEADKLEFDPMATRDTVQLLEDRLVVCCDCGLDSSRNAEGLVKIMNPELKRQLQWVDEIQEKRRRFRCSQEDRSPSGSTPC